MFKKLSKKIILFLTVTLLLTGCFGKDQELQTSNQPENKATEQNLQMPENENKEQVQIIEKENLNIDESDQLLEVLSSNNPELCDGLATKSDSCYQSFALKNNDAQYCNLIKDLSTKDFCADLVNHILALENDNISICNNIKNENKKFDCQTGIISQQKDVSYCDSIYISNNNLMDQCQSIIISNQAWQSNNSDLCNQVPNDEYKQICFGEMQS